jgi:antitoxin component YwqK of YwqJK toxin-antitoxin module
VMKDDSIEQYERILAELQLKREARKGIKANYVPFKQTTGDTITIAVTTVLSVLCGFPLLMLLLFALTDPIAWSESNMLIQNLSIIFLLSISTAVGLRLANKKEARSHINPELEVLNHQISVHENHLKTVYGKIERSGRLGQIDPTLKKNRCINLEDVVDKNQKYYVSYYENNQMREVHIYKDDDTSQILDGKWVSCYESGQLWSKRYFNQNEKSGKWTIYYENGIVQEEGNYREGARVGKWIFYHENGQKAREGNYIMGLEDGEWHVYNENGELENDIVYGDNIHVYDSSGELISKRWNEDRWTPLNIR